VLREADEMSINHFTFRQGARCAPPAANKRKKSVYHPNKRPGYP
jgi:hypothetical protein